MTTGTLAAPRVASPGLLVDAGRFGRFSILGFTLLLTLGGAATVSRDVTASQLVALIAVGVAFHLFAYVSNDVFDLPLDRTEPLRAGSPLVRGVVRPSVALAIAMVPVPLACVLHILAGGALIAGAALAAGMLLMLIYNRFGKRMALPLISDAVQAAGWVALALYGAWSVDMRLTAPLGWFAATVFVYVMLINGLHGGLRDLQNDARQGARTTAIYLGARTHEDGRLIVPPHLARYGFALQLALVVLGVASVARWPIVAAAIVVAHVVLFAFGSAALRPTASRKEVVRVGFLHLFISLGVVLLPFALYANAIIAAAMLTVYGLPVAVLCIRMPRVRSLLALMLVAGAVGAEPVIGVTQEQLEHAMRAETGYTITATPNGARFNSNVLLSLARAAHDGNPNGAPLFISSDRYFAAYLAVTDLRPEQAPAFIAEAHRNHEDQLVDYRRANVIVQSSGPQPLLAVNVVAGWTGGKARYSYEDHQSDPALRVTHERFSSYRLLDFGDMQLIDDVQGVSGRALTGFLSFVFSMFGDAAAVRSYSTIAPDNTMITLTTGRKGFSVTVSATVWPDGRAEKNVPDNYLKLESRLRNAGFRATYVPIAKKSPSERRE